MTGILRFIGIMNAAVWLGGTVFFTFVAGQVPFSPEMKALLGRLGAEPGAYLGGMIAQIGVARFFTFQLICCIIALLHLVAEWLYQERRSRNFLLGLLGAMLLLTLAGDFWLRPRMERLFKVKYATNYPAEQRQAAARSFGLWHGASMTMNLFMLGGLVIYTWHMSRPPESPRYVRPQQIRG
jgi:hypothetical protein